MWREILRCCCAYRGKWLAIISAKAFPESASCRPSVSPSNFQAGITNESHPHPGDTAVFTLLSRRALLSVLFLAFVGQALAQDTPLQTVAESSDYKATSRHADVVAFCDALAKRSS